MAEATVIEPKGQRVNMALEATWEIEQLAEMMLNSINDDTELLNLRGLTVRIKDLNSVIMSALGDPDDQEIDIYRRLTGRLMVQLDTAHTQG